MMKYKLLCVDVDGTLAKNDKSISNVNKQALKEIASQGIKVAIASGRTPIAIRQLFKELKIPGIMICLNGAYVEIEGEVIHNDVLSLNQLQTACDILFSYNTNATFNTPNLSIRSHDVSLEWKKQIEQGSLKADYIIGKDFEDYKQLIFDNADKIVKISVLERDLQKYYRIKNDLEKTDLFAVAKSDTDYVDITNKNCTKGNAIRKIAQHLKINLDEVVCIGDNENDKEMLEIAGLSIVMANGLESVKKIADLVTLDNENNGVAYAIKNYILEES